MYLNCKTYYSYRYGTFSTEELVNAAVEAGASSLALTNINNTADVWAFVDHCKKADIKPLLGVECRNVDEFCYILLARDNTGFRMICECLSGHLMQKTPFPPRPVFSDHVQVIYSLGINPESLLPNEWIGVTPWETNKLFGVDMTRLGKKFLVRQPVTFQDNTYFKVHRLLRAIDRNLILSKQKDEHQGHPNETFLPLASLFDKFRRYPQLVTNTLQLMENCRIEMDPAAHKNKKNFTGSLAGDRTLLKKLALDGLVYRYGKNNKEARDRVTEELRVIEEMGFNAYFLITWDTVRYAKSRSFYYVGRGSGANSIVAFCLKITDVDPIELDLYFSRFLNEFRTSPPDFDMDFSWRDRDEVIEYVLMRYGKDHTALLGSHGTFKYRASVRELGKVFGLPESELTQLSRGYPDRNDKNHRQILEYANLIKGFPNHHSIHAGGILITEEPIYQYSALNLPPKGFPATHIDMYEAEAVGIFKLDVLSQRGLGHIRECVELVKERHGVDIDIQDIRKIKSDAQVAAQIRKADTIGCFYIESPAMRNVLRKLRCDDYLTLVAASSIIRPGVGSSGMMQQYIWRFHHPKGFQYLHPKMEELLAETYGVMVYQEDVIKVAHHFGGLSMAEADILRRAMSGKFRGHEEMERLEAKFWNNCRERGYPDDITREVWRQIASFAGYSFSKAHSASYAVESYQSLYLKTYYPIEFLVAVINNGGGFYSRELYFMQLQKIGIKIQPPCVNHSRDLAGIVNNEVYVGLAHIKGLRQDHIETIQEERTRNGAFLHLQDFIERVPMEETQLNLLIQIAAFRFTGKTKGQILWESDFLLQNNSRHVPAGQALFQEAPVEFALPELPDDPLRDMVKELELLNFSTGTIFDLVDADPAAFLASAQIPANLGKTITVLGYLICTKDASTKEKNELMHFGTFVDSRLDWIDTVHFPRAASEYPFQQSGFYAVTGAVTEEFGVYAITVESMQKIGTRSVTV